MGNPSQAINERMRLIRWRMANEKTSLGEELRLIPRWLMGLVAALFVAAHVVSQIVIARVPEAQHGFSSNTMVNSLAVGGIVTVVGLFVGVFILLVGYVNRDAKLRGMRYILWTFIALLVPYFIGVISYFLVREPLLYSCPECGATVSARFNFCPSCKFNLLPTCPQCKQEVRIGDHYCPHCAYDLASPTAPTSPGKAVESVA